jgi:hypothetical protein
MGCYKKDIYELKKTTQNMGDELNKHIENLRKKSNRNTGNKKFI